MTIILLAIFAKGGPGSQSIGGVMPALAATTPGPRPRTGRSPNAVARAATARSRCGRVIRRPALSGPPRPWSRLTAVSTSGRRRDSSGGSGRHPTTLSPAFAIPAACDSMPSGSAVPRAWHPGSIGSQEDRLCRPRARDCPVSPPFAPSRSSAHAASRCRPVRPSIRTTPRCRVVNLAHARVRRASRTTSRLRKRCRSTFRTVLPGSRPRIHVLDNSLLHQYVSV